MSGLRCWPSMGQVLAIWKAVGDVRDGAPVGGWGDTRGNREAARPLSSLAYPLLGPSEGKEDGMAAGPKPRGQQRLGGGWGGCGLLCC